MADVRNSDPFLSIVNDGDTYRRLYALVAREGRNRGWSVMSHLNGEMTREARRAFLDMARDHDSVPACDFGEVGNNLTAYFFEKIDEAAQNNS